MQPLARSGYTNSEVDAALHAANRTVDFRYDLLDSSNAYKSPLTTVIGASVANNNLAQIKRTARFTIRDDGAINYLSDRIKPYARLKMPDVTRVTDNYNLSFDGVDDYISLNSASTTGSFTVECWIKNNQITKDTMFLSNGGPSYFRVTLNKLFVSISAGGQKTLSGLTPLLQDIFYHVAFTYDGTTLKIYLNGVLDNSSIIGIAMTPFNLTRIGRWVDVDQRSLNGLIDDIRLWNVARTQSQIAASMNSQLVGNEIGLVGYWKFDEGIGLTAFDSTANGNNGTLTNGPAWVKEGLNKTVVPSSYVEFPLGVFLLSTPPRKAEPSGKIRREVEAYDQLQVLMDDVVDVRYSIAAGVNYIVAVKALLDSAGITSQNLTATTSTLPAARDWDPGTTKLQIINDLLGAINYRSLFFDENGIATAIPYQSPAARASEYTYIDDSLSVIFPEVEQALDLFGIPNKWTLVLSEPDRSVLTSSYTNSNPSSLTSTVSRGRTISRYLPNQEAADQTTLDALAVRIAFEQSQVFETVTFETAICPYHGDSDVYTLVFSALGINAKYSEVSWEFELKAGAKMKHTIRKIVYV